MKAPLYHVGRFASRSVGNHIFLAAKRYPLAFLPRVDTDIRHRFFLLLQHI